MGTEELLQKIEDDDLIEAFENADVFKRQEIVFHLLIDVRGLLKKKEALND